MNEDFLPVIIGSEINTYNWARSFNDHYGVKAYLISTSELGITSYSTIIKHIRIVPNLLDEDIFVKALIEYANDIKREHPNKKLILIANSDESTELVSKYKDVLEEHFLFNVPDYDVAQSLLKKNLFYPLAEKHDLSIPKTWIVSLDDVDFSEIDTFPVVVKSGNPVKYYQHPFEGQEKIYLCHDKERLKDVLTLVKSSGYDEEMIIQEYVAGEDDQLYDSVIYINQEGQPQIVSFAQVALQEADVTAVGNYTALVATFNREIMKKLVGFLVGIGYTGFANIDLKYDEKDDTLKVFEVNIRAGRSSYYIEGLGSSLAKCLVEDVVYGKSSDELEYLEGDLLFNYPPSQLVQYQVQNPELKRKIKRLISEGSVLNSLYNPKDKSIKRRLWFPARQANYYKKYMEGSWTDRQKE